MAKLATKTEWIDGEGGVRRLIVEGQPVPPGVALEEHADGDDVDPRSLTRPVVDEEASKSMAERTGATPQEPNAGVSTENAEASSRRSSGRGRSRPAASSGGSES